MASSVVTRKRKWRSSETRTTSGIPDINNSGSSSSRSSSDGRDYENEYEVFLSFRGPDTRLTITDSLYSALIHAGISVFKDNEELRVGEEIGGELLRAIDNSKIYIPIFSKDYASSKWCLREIAQMVDCKRKSTDKVILPVFFGVDADDVKLKTELYRKALQKHSNKSTGKDVKKQWEDALVEVSKIKGLNLKDHGLSKLTQVIVEQVCGALWTRSERNMNMPENLVGSHGPMGDIMELLGQGISDVRFVVIHGMGGIGKTTLARLVFNQISSQFGGHCVFLPDVRASSHTVGGIVNLQQKLLSEILNLRSLTIRDVNEGIHMIKQRLKNKKVLIVLDDLDKSDKLNKLACTTSWFGKGSRIIITTRNMAYLGDNEVWLEDDNIPTIVKDAGFYFYEMKAMNPNDALVLFSKHAFKSDSPPPDFDDISRKVVATARGLPLAIEVIGPLFYLKGKNEWKDKLEKLNKVVHKDVREKLMISYEDLDHDEKQIFLDIACDLIGEEKIDATYYWEARGFFPKNGVNVLMNMSLIKNVGGNKLWMHDLLRDLGKNIVYKENTEIPGKRSRLWSPKEAFDVVMRNKGTEAVIALKLGRLDASCCFTQEQFAGLTNLKFLELDGGHFANGELHGDFSELRWLSWDNCPEFQAINLSFDNLVVVKLSGNHITEDWGGWRSIMGAKHLKVLNLTKCPHLMRMPSFSAFPTLKRLVFDECHGLKDTNWSIGELKSLEYLTISNRHINTFQGGFRSLTMLEIDMAGFTELHPSIGELVALKHLRLSCPKLEHLPSSIGKLTSLLQLDIYSSGIKELPDSIGDLKLLKILEAGHSAIHCLPQSIGRLESLNELNVRNTKITELPETIGNLKRLKKVDLSETPITKLPKAIGKVCNLITLTAWNCYHMDGDIPKEIMDLYHLKHLSLTRTPIGWFPMTINQLCYLQELSFGDFYGQLPKLPVSLRSLRVDCSSLDSKRVPDLSYLANLEILSLIGRTCRTPNILQLRTRAPKMEWIVKLTKLTELTLYFSDLILPPTCLNFLFQLNKFWKTCFDLQHDGTQLPPGLTELGLGDVKLPMEIRCPLLSGLKNLSKFRLDNCWLREIQVDALGQLENLRELVVINCKLVRKISGLSCLKNLEGIFLWFCPKLIEIQGLEEIRMLELLEICHCYSIQRLPNLSSLQNVGVMSFFNCESLTSVPDVADKETCRLTVYECPWLGGNFSVYYHEYLEWRGLGT